MIFAPVIRRNTFAPRPADLALQRFLQGALGATAQGAGHHCRDVQVQQDDKAVTLQLDVPGLTREQLQIEIDGAVVRLQSVEGAPRQVRRAWELPVEVNAAASSAKLENGVLTLTLARVQPESRATRLTID
jgi:HSP20 family molecular chaperone IbpA